MQIETDTPEGCTCIPTDEIPKADVVVKTITRLCEHGEHSVDGNYLFPVGTTYAGAIAVVLNAWFIHPGREEMRRHVTAYYLNKDTPEEVFLFLDYDVFCRILWGRCEASARSLLINGRPVETYGFHGSLPIDDWHEIARFKAAMGEGS